MSAEKNTGELGQWIRRDAVGVVVKRRGHAPFSRLFLSLADSMGYYNLDSNFDNGHCYMRGVLKVVKRDISVHRGHGRDSRLELFGDYRFNSIESASLALRSFCWNMER
jgi:hypothetical protein